MGEDVGVGDSGKSTQSNAKRRRRTRRSRQNGRADSPQSASPRQSEEAGGNGSPDLRPDSEVSALLSTTGDEVKQLLEAADDATKKIREAASTEGSAETTNGPAGSAPAGRATADVKRVLESAEEAAEKIREEAREEARQFMAEARRRAEGVLSEEMHRVSALTEDLVREAARVQGQLEALQAAFDQAIKRMGAELETEDSRVWGTPDNGAGASTDDDSESLRSRLGRRRRTHVAPQSSDGVSEGARLLALQQMMTGVDPDVIEERLREEFGIEDPGPVLKWMGLEAPKT